MTTLEALQNINGYPIPIGELTAISITRGLVIDADVDAETLRSKAFKLATSDVLLWLSDAPNVSQEGVSYSFTDVQRKKFKARALALAEEAGEEVASSAGTVYGYKGSRL